MMYADLTNSYKFSYTSPFLSSNLCLYKWHYYCSRIVICCEPSCRNSIIFRFHVVSYTRKFNIAHLLWYAVTFLGFERINHAR